MVYIKNSLSPIVSALTRHSSVLLGDIIAALLRFKKDSSDTIIFTHNSISLMKCPHCGNKIPDDSKFCPDCGTKVTQEKEALLDFNKCASEINNMFKLKKVKKND